MGLRLPWAPLCLRFSHPCPANTLSCCLGSTLFSPDFGARSETCLSAASPGRTLRAAALHCPTPGPFMRSGSFSRPGRSPRCAWPTGVAQEPLCGGTCSPFCHLPQPGTHISCDPASHPSPSRPHASAAWHSQAFPKPHLQSHPGLGSDSSAPNDNIFTWY